MTRTLAFLAVLFVPIFSISVAQWIDRPLSPFAMDHRPAGASPADVSFLLDAPAGKEGFIRIRNGHLAKGNGERARFWGVHFTDWSSGSVEIPPKEDAPLWAATLARFGVNLVRLHFLDLDSPRGIIDTAGNDGRSFDARQLDRLDFEVAEFKKRGIYVDLNLNVGRSYKAGDGVQDFAKIGWAKGLMCCCARIFQNHGITRARKARVQWNIYTTRFQNAQEASRDMSVVFQKYSDGHSCARPAFEYRCGDRVGERIELGVGI